jgi:O-antigen/teichoic acid export membrane protein
MTYFDRFLIAAIAGSAAVAYYTVPYDALIRVLLLPTAIQGVLFPAFVTLRHSNPLRFRSVFTKAGEVTLLLMLPVLLATLLLGNLGLRLWMGPDFSAHSTQVAYILAVGIFINSMARIPFALVQSAGHADWTAMTHLMELPIYIFAVWWLLKEYGISGAACAWSARVLVDTIVFYALGAKIEPTLRRKSIAAIASVTVLCAFAILLNWTVTSLFLRVVVVAFCSLLCGILLVWRFRGAFAFVRQPIKAQD